MKAQNTNKPAPRQVFTCPECGLRYADRATAEKCRDWCKEHKSCNLEIIKQAIDETASKQA